MYDVMIIEDEAPMRRSLERWIARSGLNLRIVGSERNAISALERLEKVGADILITDICMPVMSGLELIEEAAKRRPQIVSVLISGHQAFEYAHRALKLNVRDYLLKPLQQEQLYEVLSRIVTELEERYRSVIGIGANFGPEPDEENGNLAMLNAVAAYIEQNYFKPITIADLADRFAISHGHLTRQFRTRFRLTPIEYLIQTRLQHAKALMKSRPELKIKQIAAMVGYEDHHYFTRVFSQLTGVSPRAYKASSKT